MEMSDVNNPIASNGNNNQHFEDHHNKDIDPEHLEAGEYDHHQEESAEPQQKKKSVVDRVIKIWSGVKSNVKTAYDHMTVPSCLIPVRDKTKKYLDETFHCTEFGSSVETEFFGGVLNFFSCMYILAVIPVQMATAGYNAQDSAAVIALITGLSSIVSGIVTNLPLIIAPTTAVSIYYVSNIRQFSLTTHEGNLAVSFAGIIVIMVGIIGPIGRLISKLIPAYIQYSITIGIGLMTALSGLIEIDVVVRGRYTILAVGSITNEIVIAMSGLIITAIGVYYHSKISYVMGLFWGTVVWWSAANEWPTHWAQSPNLSSDLMTTTNNGDCILLIFEIFLLILLTMFGLAKALCDLADVTPSDQSIPRGRLLILIIGATNIFSGLLYGPPIMISPESASGIKAGSKTGLSAVVAGVLFVLSMFFAPLFSAIPAAGTTPVLIMIGMLLFQNISRIDFSSKYGMPAFMCLIIIPFTDSIIGGIGFGYVTYTIIAILTGDFTEQCKIFLKYYCVSDDKEGSSPGDGSSDELSNTENATFDGPALILTGVSEAQVQRMARRRRTIRRRPSVSQSEHGGVAGGISLHGTVSAHGAVQSPSSNTRLSPVFEQPRDRTGSGGPVRDRIGSGGVVRDRTGSGGQTRDRTGSSESQGSNTGEGGDVVGRGRSGTIDNFQKESKKVMTFARRASVAFINSITTEVDFQNDIKPVAMRFEAEQH